MDRALDPINKIAFADKAADLPVVQLSKIDLVINVPSAHALGLTIPPQMLAVADEVVE